MDRSGLWFGADDVVTGPIDEILVLGGLYIAASLGSEGAQDLIDDVVDVIEKFCEDDDDCKDPLSDWEWKRLVEKHGMEGHPHTIKQDIIGGSIRLFDLCKCKDGSIVVRRKGCTGESQPTGFNVNDL